MGGLWNIIGRGRVGVVGGVVFFRERADSVAYLSGAVFGGWIGWSVGVVLGVLFVGQAYWEAAGGYCVEHGLGGLVHGRGWVVVWCFSGVPDGPVFLHEVVEDCAGFVHVHPARGCGGRNRVPGVKLGSVGCC